jgi:hypothetical protein
MRALGFAAVFMTMTLAPTAAMALPACMTGSIPPGQSDTVNGQSSAKYAVTSTKLVIATTPSGTIQRVGSLYQTAGAGYYFGYGTAPRLKSVAIASANISDILAGYKTAATSWDATWGHGATPAVPQILSGAWPLTVTACAGKWH